MKRGSRVDRQRNVAPKRAARPEASPERAARPKFNSEREGRPKFNTNREARPKFHDGRLTRPKPKTDRAARAQTGVQRTARPKPSAARTVETQSALDRAPSRPESPQQQRRLEPPRSAAALAAWLYGRHTVAAALANPARRIRRIIALPEMTADLATFLAAARADLPSGGPETLDRRALETLLPEGAVHQGLAVIADPLPKRDIADIVADLSDGPHVVVALDQVTDPHNAGAILRSAAAFGALAMVVPEHGAAPVTGVLAKAASGALEAVPLLRVGNLVRALGQLKAAGFWCVGLDAEGEESLAALDLPQRVALVLGAEGGGLRRLTREHCDFLAHLPTRGGFASLNVSNAAAVALYELSRRSTRG